MGFVFFDVETTGTDRCYDQVLQFAAILTDGDLVERDRVELSCRMLPHVVPAPGALTTTRQSIRAITDEQLPTHYEMMTKVARQLESWSPAVFAGWNSLAFDEEMLRQALYQSLHPPYLTLLNGNGRIDVLRVARAATLLDPGALIVPRREDGRGAFALEPFARANGMSHVNPHRAISDVEATLGIARLIEERSPETWSTAMRFCRKASVADFLAEGEPVGLVDMEDSEPVVIPVVPLGVDPGRTNALLVYDLREDAATVEERSAEERPAWRLPRHVRRVATNACPIMLTLDDLTWPDDWPDQDVVRNRARLVVADRSAVGRMLGELAWTPPAPSPHLERRLHGQFYQAADLAKLQDFHKVDWRQRAAMAQTFEDSRLRRLARRLVLQHAPELLTDDERARGETAIARRLLEEAPNGREWRTLALAEAQTSSLVATNQNGRYVLDEFFEWLASMRQSAESIAGLIG